MGVVHQPVEDATGQRGIADLFVPARDRQLRGKDRRTHLVAGRFGKSSSSAGREQSLQSKVLDSLVCP